MASIKTNDNGGMIRFDMDDWLAGLTPYWGGPGYRRINGNKGFVSMDSIDPLRNIGAVAPGTEAVGATNDSQATTYAKDGVALSGYAYLTAGDRLLKLDYVANSFVADANFPHTITPHGIHTGVVANNVVVYYIGTTPYVFYSWNDNTDGDVGRLDPTGPTFDDDYMSTVPTSGAVLDKSFPHPMIVGDDGRLYIANGRDLASFTGTAYNSSALDLPPGFIITSMAKTQNYLVLFAMRPSYSSDLTSASNRQECNAYFWDYVSSSYTYAIPLNGNTVNGAFSYDGTVGCFIGGSSSFTANNRQSALMVWNGGGSFQQVALFDTEIPSSGGVEAGNNTLLWNSEGYIYQYGNPFTNESNMYRVSKATGSESGMLRSFGTNRFFVSSEDATVELLGGYKDGANFETVNINVPFPELQKAQVKKIKIFWYNIGSETTKKYRVNMYYRVNNGSTDIQFLDQDSLANFSADATDDNWVTIIHEDTDSTPFQTFSSSISLFAQYNTESNTITPPLIKAVEIYYEYVAA